MVTTVHILAAAAAGGVVGGCIGYLGTFVTQPTWRPWELGAATLASGLVSGRRTGFGRRRQVPRTWLCRLGPLGAYGAWGAMLGSGLATLIPYSSFLILSASELALGAAWAALAGLAYGIGREAPILGHLARSRSPAQILDTLPQLHVLATRSNLALTLFGGMGITALALR